MGHTVSMLSHMRFYFDAAQPKLLNEQSHSFFGDILLNKISKDPPNIPSSLHIDPHIEEGLYPVQFVFPS